jgi:hypothetical protein
MPTHCEIKRTKWSEKDALVRFYTLAVPQKTPATARPIAMREMKADRALCPARRF